MNTGPLGLQQPEFWSNPYKTRDEVYQRLSEEDFIGLMIDAPAQVNIEERQTLPVIGCRSAATWQAQRTNFSRSVLISALETRTGRLLANRAQVQRVFSEPISDEQRDPGEGVIMSLFDLDLRERLPELPWEPGSYLLTVILQEQVSNRIVVNLVSSQPRVSGRLATGQASAVSPPPGNPLPSYRPGKDSLGVPKRAGIDLSIDSRIVVTTQASCILRGSYRLPLLRHHLIGLEGLDAETTLSNFEEPVATIPMTLLLTGSETPGPFLIPMRIPSYDELVADSVAVEATGTFALDLFETAALVHREPQIYYLYAFSDKLLAGPFKFELLRDEA